ncbi:AAA family ATPase [Parvibaculum sp.]|uniref:AAA family ATPase n=1 Tax=Parvibaculum sp. TaxID=2024848 RepID=UPI001D5D1C5C|nr:AAA family ATPase [Parvibaculum sp.]MBX3491010.1 AAA family ATPase [Parvibaculum sp.]
MTDTLDDDYMDILNSLTGMDSGDTESNGTAATPPRIIPEDVNQRLQVACAGTSFLTLEDLRNQPLPEHLIEGLLVEKTLSSLYGPSGFGKSFIALDWAMAIATGRPVWEREVQAGLVLYVVAEGEGGFPLRTTAWEVANGVANPPSAIIFEYVPLDLSDQIQVQTFMDRARALAEQVDVPLSLIVLDTLARCMSGNESATDDMKTAVEGADTIRRELDTSVLLVHHSRKDDGEVMRGSSALWASLQTIVNIKKGQVDGEIIAVVKKQKDGPEEAFRLSLDPVECGMDESGKPLDSLAVRFIEVVDEVKSPRRLRSPDHLTPSEESMLSLLDDNPEGVTRKEWHALGEMVGVGTGRSATRNEAIKSLQRKGRIREDDGRFFVVS